MQYLVFDGYCMCENQLCGSSTALAWKLGVLITAILQNHHSSSLNGDLTNNKWPLRSNHHKNCLLGANWTGSSEVKCISKRVDDAASESRFDVHSGNLTLQWKFPFSNRKLIYKWWIFHGYVRLPEGIKKSQSC